MALPQLGVEAGAPDLLQAVVEDAHELVVAALDRDADPVAEEFRLPVEAADKAAAAVRRGAVEPEGERDGIAEQGRDPAGPQGLAGAAALSKGLASARERTW